MIKRLLSLTLNWIPQPHRSLTYFAKLELDGCEKRFNVLRAMRLARLLFSSESVNLSTVAFGRPTLRRWTETHARPTLLSGL